MIAVAVVDRDSIAASAGDFSTGEPDTGQGITTGPVKHDPDVSVGTHVTCTHT